MDAYRSAEVGPVAKVIVAGRVPVRWQSLLVVTGMAVAGALFLFFAFETQGLRCVAPTGGEAWCTVSTYHPFLRERSQDYPRARLLEVRSIAREGKKGTTLSHDVLLRFANGAELDVLSYSDAEDAETAQVKIAAFLEATATPMASPNIVPTVELRDHVSWLGVVFGGALWIAFAVFAWQLLRGLGRYVFVVDHREGALVATRRIFGLPIKRIVHRIDEVQGIDVDSGPVSDWTRARREPEDGARFEVVLRDGRRVPLSSAYQRGDFHYEAASAVEATLRKES